MIRLNGFLDLDSYFENVKQEEHLSDLDLYSKGYIRKTFANKTHRWMKINNEDYYFKISEHPYAEVLAYEVAKFLGMNATPYDIATFNGNIGTISKSYRKRDCKYISGTKILIDFLNDESNMWYLESKGFDKNKIAHVYNDVHIAKELGNLEVIWQAIEQRYVKQGIIVDMESIMNSLVDQFIFNILTLQNDGFPQNWELEEGPNGVSVVPLFDNELCFIIRQLYIYPSNILSTNFSDAGKSNYEILKEFLQVSSQEFIDKFLSKYNMLTLEIFLELIQKTEDEIGCEIPSDIKEKYIANFKFNREHIDQVIQELKITSSRK